REYDPFQMDLEWFKYELAIKINWPGEQQSAEIPGEAAVRLERHAARGKINRKDLSILLAGVDDLILRGKDLKFEPYDLRFYLEWKMETEHVYSIITWFDLALLPREARRRFPSAHAGFRFLVEEASISAFRAGLEAESTSPGPELE